MSERLIAQLAAAGPEMQLLLPGDSAFAALSARFAVHPGVEARYIAAVRPADAEQVRQAVALAHREGAGLLTVFNAANAGAHLRGSGETLILDLSRLDRVLEVNVDNGFARVEPGVSYAALEAHFAEHGLALQVDSERDAGASVAGSTFAKGFGYTPYGEHALVQCGGEYALPYGELMRTGMGAMEGSKTWQVYKYALGPYADGLAMQSGLMVPTQIGVWLMGQVPVTQVLGYELEDEEALAATAETLRGLKLANLLPGTVSLTHRAFDKARHPGSKGKADWRLTTALYGLPRLIALARSAVEGALGQLTGVRAVSAEEIAASPVWQEQAGLVSGQPGSGPAGFPGVDAASHASMTFVAPIEGRFAMAMQANAAKAAKAHSLPLLCEMAIVGRSLLQKVCLPYDPADKSAAERLAACAKAMASAQQADGIGIAAQSFELAALGLGRNESSGLAELHRKIEHALTA